MGRLTSSDFQIYDESRRSLLLQTSECLISVKYTQEEVSPQEPQLCILMRSQEDRLGCSEGVVTVKANEALLNQLDWGTRRMWSVLKVKSHSATQLTARSLSTEYTSFQRLCS